MGYPATGGTAHGPAHYAPEPQASGVGLKLLSLFLGLAVLILAALGFWLATSAQSASDDAERAAAAAAPAGEQAAGDAAHATAPAAGADDGVGAVATPSYAGLMAPDAEKIAAAHEPFPAELPALQAGPVARVNLSIEHEVVEIAPGVKYQAWSFGKSIPGPVINVRQGQLVKVTMKNTSPMPHSIDFHAARIAPDKAFVDIAPGESFTFQFRADDPGVYMYHCGTKPVLAHIANGMYGAIVVQPKEGVLEPAHHEYVLVSSEWYLNRAGLDQPASLDMTKANQMIPDWVTWNGYANQYVTHPLRTDPGHLTRFWVVAAGPSLDTDFHVVGTLLNRAYVNQDVTQYQRNVGTASVPAGGGAIFDVKIDEPGLYPFVSHSFASVNMGQVGLLEVGNPKGTMSH
ncbi:MAG TPA: multicopper oxidase domain-containing protein [Gaiellaceae bacterium]|jgi:copper-containing nitrite reductase|nr:multicopper oxidase domain-containing protein [Gaiellaceae bacterium]